MDVNEAKTKATIRDPQVPCAINTGVAYNLMPVADLAKLNSVHLLQTEATKVQLVNNTSLDIIGVAKMQDKIN